MIVTQDPDLKAAIKHSRFMQSLATAYPDWLEEAIKLRSVNQFIRDIEQYETSHEEQLLLQIRKAHHIVLARTIYDDLKRRIGLPEVFSNMSDLADQLVQLALKAHTKWLVERFGHPTNDNDEIQELHVVAMGKLGGGELNVSSDIDLIFTYPDQGKTNGDDPISSYEFFSKLAKKIIHALAFPNQHGFSFRVDTRLRPFGNSGPLVCNHSALEQYLYSHGRAWERYAWIKARVITGDKKDSLKNIYEPFVYRKHVDFTSIENLRKLRTEISIAASRIENDLDIKIGTGGIREIEFIAQLFQLMRGGTDVNLRDQSTLATLQKLNEKKLLAPETVKDLSDSYRFLRTLEHRIQYLDNAQTHQLPKDPNDQALLAESMGYITWDELLKRTKATRSAVNRHFTQIFSSEAQEGLSDITPITLSNVDEIATLNNLSKKQDNVSPVKNFLQSGKFRRLSAHSQSKIELLLPYFLKDARELDHDISYPLVKGVIEILEAIGGIDSYLSLLIEFPNVRKRLLDLVERSSWATEYLSKHPSLLDELIHSDSTNNKKNPVWETPETWDTTDLEATLDSLVEYKNNRIFDLLLRDLFTNLDVSEVSDELSNIADSILSATLRVAWDRVGTRSASPRFAIIAYGKLGGRELAYESDLDLIFLFDETPEVKSETIARLAQKINSLLNTNSRFGKLYQTDLRLRPNGNAGLLVSTTTAFEHYQHHDAWTWEHQALTRARGVCGDREVLARFESIRASVLQAQRDPKSLKKNILDMRQTIAKTHQTKQTSFDLKHDPGGIIDIEFITQYLVLRWSRLHPELINNIGNSALLNLSGALQLIDANLASEVAATYRILRKNQHERRLSKTQHIQTKNDNLPNLTNVVRELWDKTIGEQGPT